MGKGAYFAGASAQSPLAILLSVCQKTIFPVVETVGANIVRPQTWRSNVFSGRFLTRQTGTGAQCAPLQCTFTLGGCFINNADGKDTVGTVDSVATVDTVDDGHHQRLVGGQGDVLGSDVCMGACSIAQFHRGGDDYGVGWLRLFAAVDALAVYILVVTLEIFCISVH